MDKKSDGGFIEFSSYTECDVVEVKWVSQRLWAQVNASKIDIKKKKKIERNKERKIHHYERKGERGSLECTLHFCASIVSDTWTRGIADD